MVGRSIVRSVFDHEGVVIGRTEGRVVGWLDVHESDYVDSSGKPAALWHVRYLTGALVGDEVDLEEQEVLESLPHHQQYPQHHHPVVKEDLGSPWMGGLLTQLRGMRFGVKKIRAVAGSSSVSPRCLG